MPTKTKIYKLTDKDFTPRSKAQELFFKRDLEGIYDICLGGSAYGGKTVCMLISSLFYVDNPNYRAAFFRREQAQLENSGLLDEAEKWYKQIYPEVIYNKTLKLFTFPSGARIRFHGCEGELDYNKFKGVEWHALYIEEATQFTEDMIGFLASRVRNPKGKIPFRIRMTTNPGDIHEEHIMNKYMPWIYKNCIDKQDPPIKALDGQVLYYYADEDKDYEIQIREEKPAGKHLEDYFSFCFIKTSASDLGDGQKQRLAVNIKDPILRAQQLDGIWGLKTGAGMFFNEIDFKLIDNPPKIATRCRYWDKACSGKRGDFLCGVLLSRTTEDTYIIEDCILSKPEVHEIENIILSTCLRDKLKYGNSYYVGIEQEGGSSGKEISLKYENLLRKNGIKLIIDIKKASKIERATMLSTIVKEGRFGILSGGLPWKNEFFKQLTNFPNKNIHDDAPDSCAGSYFLLSTKIPAPLSQYNEMNMIMQLQNALPDNLYGR